MRLNIYRMAAALPAIVWMSWNLSGSGEPTCLRFV
jgi:hypothetical protein